MPLGHGTGRRRGRRSSSRPVLGLLAALALLLAACTQGEAKEFSAPARVDNGPKLTGDAAIRGAVVQVIPNGGLTAPSLGATTTMPATASGFIFDEAGLALTSSHLVMGVEAITVYVGTEKVARKATVLASSECSGLAVIDIDGDHFPFLPWGASSAADGALAIVGFKAGASDFLSVSTKITGKPVAKATRWAVAKSALGYEGAPDPGLWGGPLIDKTGHVLGVLSSRPGTEGLITSVEEAKAVAESLRASDVESSLGINAIGIVDVQNGLRGVWVAGVDQGSPAEVAGIRSGDVITDIGGSPLGTDGTLKPYCDALTTSPTSADTSIRTIRPKTGATLVGSLAPRGIVETVSGAVPQPVAGRAADYAHSRTVRDVTKALQVRVPFEWGSVIKTASQWGPSLTASAGISGFLERWDSPGVYMVATRKLGPKNVTGMMDLLDPGPSCVKDAPKIYDDSVYTGRFSVFRNCGGVGTIYVVIAVTPRDDDYVLGVTVQLLSSADWNALQGIIETFHVIGVVP